MSIICLSEFLPKLGSFLLRLEFLASTQRQVERRLVVLWGTFVHDDGLEPRQEGAAVIRGILDCIHENVIGGSVS